jgi:hypothetical protein
MLLTRGPDINCFNLKPKYNHKKQKKKEKKIPNNFKPETTYLITENRDGRDTRN